MTKTDIVFAVAVVGSTVGLVTLVSAAWWYLAQPPAVVDERPLWPALDGRWERVQPSERLTLAGVPLQSPAWRILPRRPYDWARDGD